MKFIAVIIILIPVISNAAIVPNITGDRPATLPKRRIMATSAFYYSELSKQYDSTGRVANFSDNLNRNIGWNDVLKSDQTRSDQLSGLLQSKGINLNDSAGSFTGDFKGTQQTTVPVFGFGITDSLGLYAALPVVRFQAHSSIAYQKSQSSEDFVNALRASNQNSAADEFAQSLNSSFDTQLAKAGYKFEDTIDKTYVGDLQLDLIKIVELQKYRDFKIAIIPSLIVPTGKKAEMNDLYQFSTTDYRYQIGARTVVEMPVASGLTFIPSAAIMQPLNATIEKRIPKDESDLLASDIDKNTNLSGGFFYTVRTDLRQQLSRSWAIRGGFEHSQRLEKTYSGNLYSQNRYALLNKKSGERLDVILANLELSTIRAFLDRDFILPTQLNIGAGLPVSGTNTLANTFLMCQAAFFF